MRLNGVKVFPQQYYSNGFIARSSYILVIFRITKKANTKITTQCRSLIFYRIAKLKSNFFQKNNKAF